MQHDMGVGQILEELVSRARRASSSRPWRARLATVGAIPPASSVIFSTSSPSPSEVCATPRMRASGTCHTPEGRVVVTYSVISFR